MTGADLTVDAVVAWFEIGRRAPESSDREELRPCREVVSLYEHGLQCAQVLAGWHPDDIELQVAGLLHDLGHHFQVGVADRSEDHERLHGFQGAEAVRGLFGDRVAQLIELHVPAKRYLVSFEPTYADVLSAVSTYTLERQGGRMTDAERVRYEALPFWHDALQLRRADDLSKTPKAPTRSLHGWVSVMHQLAADRTGRRSTP